MRHSPRKRRLLRASPAGSARRLWAAADTGLDADASRSSRPGETRRSAKDLANYDREFGLDLAVRANGPCPTVVNGEGKRHPPAVEGNAPLETSLDVEVAHAVCPGCNLLLVEASSESLARLRRSH